MADSIRFAVSVTPVEELADENSGTHEVIAGHVAKSLGGDGEAVVTNYDPNQGDAADEGAYQGFYEGTQYYCEAIDSADTTDISSEASASFVYIKNTGYTYSSATALGDALNKALKVMVGTTMISVLDPGEAIVLKDDNAGIACTGIHVRTVDLDGGENASAGHLAVEFLVVD